MPPTDGKDERKMRIPIADLMAASMIYGSNMPRRPKIDYSKKAFDERWEQFKRDRHSQGKDTK